MTGIWHQLCNSFNLPACLEVFKVKHWGKILLPYCNFLDSRSNGRGNGFSHQGRKRKTNVNIINGTNTTFADSVFGTVRYLTKTKKQNPIIIMINTRVKLWPHYAQQLNLPVKETNTRKVCLMFLYQWQTTGIRTTETAANNIRDGSGKWS